MRTIEKTVTITAEGTLIVQVPADISPGEYYAVVVLDERPKVTVERPPLDFPVIHVDAWPDNLSLRREDMYGDDGR